MKSSLPNLLLNSLLFYIKYTIHLLVFLIFTVCINAPIFTYAYTYTYTRIQAGPSVHQKCLQAILRMIHHASADLLTSVLSCKVVASCIASMLTSSHIGAVVNGLQMTTILMQKMPQQFNSFFRREGLQLS